MQRANEPFTRFAALVVIGCLLATASERASAGEELDAPTQSSEQDGQDAHGEELPPKVPRPHFMSRRPYIPDSLLKDKREGRYVTAVPAIGFDPEEGFGLGVLAEFYDNGKRDDPYFATAPYRQNISLFAQVTSESVESYAAWLDQPYVFDSPFRLRVGLAHGATDLNNYFGEGHDSLRHFNFPGEPGKTFDRWSSYHKALRRETDGFAYTKYNNWGSESFLGAFSVEMDTFGGIVRPLLGFKFESVDVHDFTGDRVGAKSADGKKVEAIQLPTKMREDCEAGILHGCDGGFDNFVKLGLTYDTRDFEPDPQSGILAQAAAELGSSLLGSSNDYQRLTLSTSGYVSPFDRIRLVLAGRGLYSMQFGDVPFYSLGTLAFTVRDRQGLGGHATMRGFKRNRFVGESAVLVNGEARWSITNGGYLWGQHLRPMLVPFIDAGRVFDGIGFELNDWKVSFGAGFRLAWNLSTIASFDFGVSSEEEIFYMELGHQF
jgi:hypothetical protein